MNRSEFLKTIGLGGTGIIIPGASSLGGIQQKPVKIYDNYVKGLVHYDFEMVKETIKTGEPLSLRRDIENVYDSFAIAVFYNEYKMGYIPAYENIVPANLLDQGMELKAFVSRIDTDERAIYTGMSLEIWAKLIITEQKIVQRDLLSKRADEAPDIYRDDMDF